MENKFYMTEIIEGDKTIQGKKIAESDNINDAEANFHSECGKFMKSPLCSGFMINVVDSMGNPFFTKAFSKTQAESIDTQA